MAMRCMVPVRLSVSHWAGVMASSTPMVSAWMSPATGLPPSAADSRSRTACRQTSADPKGVPAASRWLPGEFRT